MPNHRQPGVTQPAKQHLTACSRAVRIALLSLGCCALPPGIHQSAQAAENATGIAATQTYAIPAGPLADVLARFGQASGILLSYPPGLAANRQSPGVSGQHTIPSALARLLAGTGLETVPQANGGYTLRALPPAAPGEASLAPLTVTANVHQENAWGPVGSYVAKRSATATKTDTPLIETPQSITVVSAEQLEALKPQSITEALGYSAGVFRSEDIDSTRDQMTVRGFQLDAEYGSYFRDGLKYTVNGFNGQQEPYGLERIELLRGAASVLYGLSAPGGLINTVSKRPTTETLRELNLSVGSFDRKQISGDFGGALTEDGVWSYRLTGLYRDSNTFIDSIKDDRTYIAPALKWQPDAATSLTLLAEYQKDLTAYNNGLPQSGTLLPNINGKISRDRFLGEPGLDKFDNTRWSLGYLFEHAFSDELKFRHNLRYLNAKNDYVSTSIGLDLDATERLVTYRSVQKRHDVSSALVADTSLQYRWDQGPISHTTLVGVDISHARHQSERFQASADPIDIYSPAYGAPIGPYSYLDYSWKAESNRLGVYMQDQMKIANRWVLTLNGRQDWVKDKQCTFADSSNCPVNNEKSNAFTGRAGLVYLAPNGLAPFVSFSQSWEPTNGFDREGNRLVPTEGEQYEAGVRFQPPGSDTILSAAAYQLTRKNVLVDDPLNLAMGDYFQIQQGEVRSKGVELEAKTRLGRHLNIIAAYAYTNAHTIKSSPSTPELEGKRTGGIPQHQASLWGDYMLAALSLPEVKIGAGVRYVGSAPGYWTDTVTPSYTLLDAMLSYGSGPWRMAFNVTNLTDKTYVALCPYRCFYGEPRKLTATLTYRW